MEKINIAVFVSGGGTNLQALIDAQKQNILVSGSIKLVISSKSEAYAMERAKRASIPAVYVPASDEEALLKLLKEYNIGLIVLAGYLSILSEYFVDRYRDRIINIHPSLIPSFCGKGFYGLYVHEAALNYGVKVTGATVHYVNKEVDGGQIISQKAVYIRESDTPESLQKRVMEEAEWEILPAATESVCRRLRLIER